LNIEVEDKEEAASSRGSASVSLAVSRILRDTSSCGWSILLQDLRSKRKAASFSSLKTFNQPNHHSSLVDVVGFTQPGKSTLLSRHWRCWWDWPMLSIETVKRSGFVKG
jgi:hypothetical protein